MVRLMHEAMFIANPDDTCKTLGILDTLVSAWRLFLTQSNLTNIMKNMYNQKVERKCIDKSVVDNENTAVLPYENKASLFLKRHK